MEELHLPSLPPLCLCVFIDLFMHVCAVSFPCMCKCACACSHHPSLVSVGRFHFPTGQGLGPQSSGVKGHFGPIVGHHGSLKRSREVRAGGSDTNMTKELPMEKEKHIVKEKRVETKS